MNRFLTKGSFLMAIWAVVLMGTSAAQSPDRKEKGGLPFTCYGWDKLDYPEMYYASGGKYLPLNFGTKSRSKIYKIKGVESFAVFVPNDDPEAKTPYKVVGQCNVPVGATRVLFIVLKRPAKSGLPLTIVSLDDDLAGFRPGTFRFMNWTSDSIGVDFDRNKKTIKPRSNEVMSFKQTAKGAFVPFLVYNKSGKLYETRLVGRSTTRSIVFIIPSENPRQKASVRFLSETIAPKSE